MYDVPKECYCECTTQKELDDICKAAIDIGIRYQNFGKFELNVSPKSIQMTKRMGVTDSCCQLGLEQVSPQEMVALIKGEEMSEGIYCEFLCDEIAQSIAKIATRRGYRNQEHVSPYYVNKGFFIKNDANEVFVTDKIVGLTKVSIDEFIKAISTPKPEPIYVGNDKVIFHKNGNLEIGCTTVPSETVEKIIEYRSKVKNDNNV